jgi:predicted DNA-binding protein YlxM (UPF0122 family)
VERAIDNIDRKVEKRLRGERMAGLLNVYGTLLTPKQCALACAHYQQGQSFSQIARAHNVSRQAVHDAVRHADRILEEYDSKLGFAAAARAAGPALPVSTDSGAKAVEILNRLKGRVARQGIIYSTEWIIKDINDVLEIIEGKPQPEMQPATT